LKSTLYVPLPYGPSYGELKLNPIWDDLRGNPRFDKIIAEAAKPIEIKEVAQQFVATDEKRDAR